MKYLVRTLCVIGLLASAAGAAKAEGEPPRFQGIYGGLFSGYAFVDQGWTQSAGAAAALPSVDFDLDGGLGGLAAGHNWNFGSYVLGIEADAASGDWDDRQGCGLMGATCTVAVGAVATVRARAGLLFGSESQYMAFVTGGLGVVWYDVSAPPAAGTLNNTEATFVVGGGLEGYVWGSDWISSKLEYLYVGLNDTRTYTTGFGTATVNFDGIHMVRWGWNLHF